MENFSFTNRTIILNSGNIVPNSSNSRLKFDFNEPLKLRQGDKIAVASVNLYKSWNNIDTTLYNNATFQYLWFDISGVLNQTITINIPDGYYTIENIQLFIESQMYANKHYLYNTVTFENQYFINFKANEVLYAFQLYVYPIPDTLLDGGTTLYTKPSDVWSLPTIPTTPQIIFSPIYKTNEILGFEYGTYPSAPSRYLSTMTGGIIPQLNPVSSIILTCNLCSNTIIRPSNVLYSFSDAGIGFGNLISEKPNQLLYINTIEGWMNHIYIELYDQNFKDIRIKDSSMVIMLSLITKDLEK